MLSEIYSDKTDMRCCGNCVYLSDRFCDELKALVPSPAAVCDFHDFDELSFSERKKLLRSDLQ